MYDTQTFLFIESLLQVFASVCPLQPKGGSLFMLITHDISIERISNNVITKVQISKKS